MSCRYRRAALLAFATLLVLPPSIPAAEPQPVDELLRLLPDNPAFCFVLRDVRGHSARLSDSPFLAEIKRSPFGAALADNKDFSSLIDVDKMLKQMLGTSFAELRDEVLGDALVFAYWPARGSDPERGVFLVKARRAELLASLVSKLRELGAQTGDIKAIEDRQYEGWTYHRMEDKAGKASFFLVRQQLAAVAEDEASLRRVIDRARQTPATNPIAKQLTSLGLNDALATLLIDPRAFDAEMEAKAKDSPEPEATFLRTLLKYWRHTETIALSLRLDRNVSVGLSLKLNAAGLPEAARRLLEQPRPPSDLWGRFPDRAMFAFAGQMDFGLLFDVLTEFAPEAKRTKELAELENVVQGAIGLHLRKEVLPNIGPDWGLFVAAPPSDTKDWFPHAVFALRLQHKPAEKPLDEAAFEPLRTLLGLIAITQSKPGKTITVKTQIKDGVQMATLIGPEVFPPGCQPTLALKHGYLLAASSPEAVGMFREAPAASKSDAAVLARLSLKEIASYLTPPARRKAIVEVIAKSNGLAASDVNGGLDQLLAALSLFDRLELVQHQTGDQLHLALHLHTMQPLRK